MRLRIHGDNIIECERTLHLLSQAYKTEIVRCSNILYFPSFKLINQNAIIAEIELFAGHDRWNLNINNELAKHGATLREATDAYVTKLLSDNKTEELLLAIEYCNALPAGNNAWQRNGRAVTCAEIGIPYLYFAEIGGVELDANRKVKAPRFPNPIVPFSYLSSSKTLNVVCVPVYQAHPAITDELRNKFTHIFGFKASLDLIKVLIEERNSNNTVDVLENKGLTLVKLLSNDRKRIDTFRSLEWEEFLKLSSGLKKAKWIKNNPNKQIWKKKSSEKISVTKSFKALLLKTQQLNCLSIGAKEIPICLIVNGNINRFASLLKSIYTSENIKKLANKIDHKNKPILIVWITGFKPRGDDSRPDRGLVPLTRMLFGNDIDILTIVYGPAVKTTWKKFKENHNQLASDNGLWQAILNLSNYVIADSITSEYGILTHIIERDLERKNVKISFPAAKPTINFSEHDVDTAIHSIFTRQSSLKIFESMCNPPGGDWSGISYFDFTKKTEYRWTSLPRVSATKSKRPDHIIQINKNNEIYFIVIESKNNAKDLDKNIGKRLNRYVNALFKIAPTAYKKDQTDWKLFNAKKNPLKNSISFSGGAYCYKNDDEIITTMKNSDLDFIISFEFKSVSEATVLHLKTTEKCELLSDLVCKLCQQFGSGVKIQIH